MVVLVGRIREDFERFAPLLEGSDPEGGGVKVSERLAFAGVNAPWNNGGLWCIPGGATNGATGFDARGFVI